VKKVPHNFSRTFLELMRYVKDKHTHAKKRQKKVHNTHKHTHTQKYFDPWNVSG
jgi:hypothetical protein